jgi:hypothetical protein
VKQIIETDNMMIRRGVDARWKFVMLMMILFPTLILSAQRVVWDVTTEFGVTVEDAKPGTDLAIAAAKNHFPEHPDDTIVLYYPEGTYDFFGSSPSFDFSGGFMPGDKGRLEIVGAGYEKTIFITKDPKADAINGKDVHRLLVKGIHFTRDYCTVSQGTVVSVAAGEVVMDLHEEFPTPDSLWQYGITGGWGLYLKRYTDDPDDPQIITENNGQVAWTDNGTYLISGRRWRVALQNDKAFPPYQPGHVIGIKLKHGGQAYWFNGGDNIHFEECKWTRKTRGKLRGGISNVKFSGCYIDRGPRIGGRVPCLASPGGGPQIGHDGDPRITNVLVENCTVIGTGDDNIALFSVDGGAILNCYVQDGFARGVLLSNVTHICYENNVAVRCEPLWQGMETESNCTPFDNEPPSVPKNLSTIEITDHSVTFTWEPSADNLQLSHYEVFMGGTMVDTTSETSYTAVGLNPSTFYLFRVRAVDEQDNFSGFSNYLEVTTLSTETNVIRITGTEIPTISIYPNPNSGTFVIKIEGAVSARDLCLLSMDGRVIYYETLTFEKTLISVSGIAPGIYFLKVGSSCHRILVK